MAEPKIYDKNYVNADDTISVGSGATANLYDRDKATQWISSGANDDLIPVEIVIDFYEGEGAVTRTIDTLILLNHNLKSYTLEYWNGTIYVSLLNITANALTNEIRSFSQVNTTRVRLTALTTQTINQEKAIGELFATKVRLDIGQDMDSYDVRYRQKIRENMLGNGEVHQAITRHSTTRTQKYEARAAFKYLPEATLEALLAIKEGSSPFLWQPESISRPDEIYYVHWSGPFAYRYVTSYKAAGFQISFDVKEI